MKGTLAEVAEAAPDGSARRALALHQAATPMATLTLGQQSDGSTRWQVVGGEMDMANNIEIQAFLPSANTHSVDSCWVRPRLGEQVLETVDARTTSLGGSNTCSSRALPPSSRARRRSTARSPICCTGW